MEQPIGLFFNHPIYQKGLQDELERENHKAPIYQSIIKHITQNIQSGQLLPGQKLPSERKLAALIGVNRSTIVRVMTELESKGIIKRQQGSGTMINDDKWGAKSRTSSRLAPVDSGGNNLMNTNY